MLSQRERHFLLCCGAGPELLMVAGAVGRALPKLGVSAADLVEFVCGQTQVLNEQLWHAFHALAGPEAHPLDGYPPQLGPIHRQMTLPEVEEAIGGEPEEYVVVFDGHEGRQIARFGPAGTRAAGIDPRGKTLLNPMLRTNRAGATSWVLTHNHPRCGTLSNLDLVLAVRLDLAEIRAVCATGVRWWCARPAAGWPAEDEMLALCNEVTELALPLAMEATDEDLPMQGDAPEGWAAIFSDCFTATFNLRAQQRGIKGLRIQRAPHTQRRSPTHRRPVLASAARRGN